MNVDVTTRPVRREALVVGALAVLAWPLVLSTFGKTDVYGVMGPFALAVAFGCALLELRTHRGAPRPPLGDVLARHVLEGVVVGAVMIAGTYALYALFSRFEPALSDRVHELYAASRTRDRRSAVAWTLVIVVAEELLWRGPLFERLRSLRGTAFTVAVSLITYTLAQGGSGSLVVMAAALVCGAFWTAQRARAGSVVPSLVAHALWTSTVIHLVPVVNVE